MFKRFALAFLASLIAVVPAMAQMTREQKLRQIDHQINEYKARRTTGMLMTAGGVGASLVSLAFVPGVECDDYTYECEDTGSYGAMSAFLIGGSVLMIWGISKWGNASSNIRLLELKRFDLSFHPLYLPEQGHAAGFAVRGGF